MASIISKIYAKKFIGKTEVAEHFFTLLQRHNMLPDKIGLYEPIKEMYSLDRAIEMWIFGNEPGKVVAGGMMGKKKNPNFLFDVGWAKGPVASINDVTFFIKTTAFSKNKEVYISIIRELFELLDGLYGYITLKSPRERQHVTGGIETRMPGVFWCNYFGPLYVDFFGREKILSGPWVKTEELDSGTIITYLADEPDKEIVESDFLEKQAKEHLGVESFGDPEEEKRNIDELQIRKVPAIVIPEVRGE
ncbi:MAG: hypothetical protein M0Z31_15625 [Clostridia bacterium]|nr:hypothetical protein [Clostridia bacterium]